MRETDYEIEGSQNLTIAVVADLHEYDPAPALAVLRSVRPDVIAVPGDLMERCLNIRRKDYSALATAAKKVAQSIDRALRFGSEDDVSRDYAYTFLKEAVEIAPVVMSLVNHELRLTEEDWQLLRDTGTMLLNNSYVSVKGVLFAGIPSKSCTGEIDEGFLREFQEEKGYRVLLCHHPEYYPLVAPYADLVLSGHCHGGQVRIRGKGVYSPGQGFFPKYHHGLYRQKNGPGMMIVSSGCANTAAIPRIGNPEEVVIVRIKRKPRAHTARS